MTSKTPPHNIQALRWIFFQTRHSTIYEEKALVRVLAKTVTKKPKGKTDPKWC